MINNENDYYIKMEETRRYCKLSDYAKRMGVTYRTAFNRFYDGKIPGAWKDKTGHICVPIEYFYGSVSKNVTIYASVLQGTKNGREILDEDAKKMVEYANARGYSVQKIIKEVVPMGIEDERPKLYALFQDKTAKHILISSKSAVGYFAYNYVNALLQADRRQLECMNEFDEDEDDLKKDYSKIIYAMCRKISGPRVSKRNIRNILDSLTLPDITHLLP